MFKLGNLEDFKQDFNQTTKKKLGKGGYGEVFSMVSNFDNQRYAIKKMIFSDFDDLKESF